MDKDLSNLLRWGIENTPQGASADPSTAPNGGNRSLSSTDMDALRAMMGGPSEADLMRAAMELIQDPTTSEEQKSIAWENLEMMVQNLDNANNLEPLKMWGFLVESLESASAEDRIMSAWCVGTAAQNNEKTQEKMLSYGAFTSLVKMALKDEDGKARKKAVYALSSGVRNFQPGLDMFLELLPKEYKTDQTIGAGDMEAIDAIIARLRESARQQ